MGPLEKQVRDDLARLIPKRLKVSAGGTADVINLPPEDQFRLVLARVEKVESTLIGLAVKLDQMKA